MDVQLQELIDTIKRDGVGEAERRKEQILDQARAESAEILAAAEAQASEITRRAEGEARRFERTATETLQHAGRDLIIAMQSQIASLLRKVATTEIDRALSDDLLSALIMAFVTAMQGETADSADSIELLLPVEQFTQLEGHIRARLAEHIRRGLTIRPFAGIESGFRISLRDGSGHIDISADSIAEALCARLGPRLAQLLRDA